MQINTVMIVTFVTPKKTGSNLYLVAKKRARSLNKDPASPEGREAQRGNEGVKKQKPV